MHQICESINYKNTRYKLLRRLFSSSCGVLWPSAEVFKNPAAKNPGYGELNLLTCADSSTQHFFFNIDEEEKNITSI